MADQTEPGSTAGSSGRSHTAGAFDIRNIIGSLLGFYGVALLLAGFFGDKGNAKTGGVNANLWTGIVLALAAAAFLIWARVRPIIVPEAVERVGDDPTRPAPRRRPTP